MALWQVDDENIQSLVLVKHSYEISAGSKGESRTYYRTFKISPSAGYGRYAVSVKRTNNSSNNSKSPPEEGHAVNIRSKVIHPDDTTVMIKVRATENATGSRDRKYNALITRHVISYNMPRQKVDYTLRPSRKFADIALHNWIIVGG